MVRFEYKTLFNFFDLHFAFDCWKFEHRNAYEFPVALDVFDLKEAFINACFINAKQATGLFVHERENPEFPCRRRQQEGVLQGFIMPVFL